MSSALPSVDFDLSGLIDYLETRVDGFRGPIAIQKFAKGQSNPTYLVKTPLQKYVLRRKPPGVLLKSAHAVDREYRVLRALEETDVPTPNVFHLCTNESVIGSWFYLMEFKEGRVFWDPALPDLSHDDRGKAYESVCETLAAIHLVDVDRVGLADYGRPGNYFERQVARWVKQYRASETETIENMELLIEWLPAHMPPDDGRAGLIHGDYRMDNLMFHHERPEVIAVFDWELSTLGHPLADLAYQAMQWSFGRTWLVMGLDGLDLKSDNIPSTDDYVKFYAMTTGLEIGDHWGFYMAFSYFRFAAICQGVKKRALDGNASNERALEVGALVGPVANLGRQVVDSLSH